MPYNKGSDTLLYGLIHNEQDAHELQLDLDRSVFRISPIQALTINNVVIKAVIIDNKLSWTPYFKETINHLQGNVTYSNHLNSYQPTAWNNSISFEVILVDLPSLFKPKGFSSGETAIRPSSKT